MRMAYRWLILLVFLVINGFVIAWAWRGVQAPEPAPAAAPVETAETRRLAAIDHQARTDKMAYDLIAQWNRAAVVKLDSDELAAAVESMPASGCIDLPDGAVAIDVGKVPQKVKADLDAAITGFLRTTIAKNADSLIAYMRGRSEIVDPRRRTGWEKGLSKVGATNLEKFNAEELYRLIFKPEPHWRGLVADSSCRQLWDGKKAPQKTGHFDLGAVDPKILPSEQAQYLSHLFRGTSRARTSFASTAGSLQESLKNDAQVLLCDVQLVIELDKAFASAKAAYLLRLWFNPAVEKWQLVELVGFVSEPGTSAMPPIYY
jgi:hypothetical protein